MAIILDKDNDVVRYENQPEQARAMFPNIDDGQNAAAAAEAARQAAAAAQAAAESIEDSAAQIETNKNGILSLEKLVGNDYSLTNGYINASGDLIAPSTTNKEVTTSFIPVIKGQVMNVTIEFNQARSAWCAFCLYDENETFIRRIAYTTETTDSKTWTYTVQSNVAYVRLSYRTFGDIKDFIVYFDDSIIERLVSIENNLNLVRKKYTRLMNRQGEGYGFPDNSIQGIISALNDGFSKIRVAVASTSDNVLYCTHSSEMKNNASANCLKLDGVTYTENVSINDVDSAFIERLLYKNYPIPKLDAVMDLVYAYDVELTLELKDTFTSAQAQILIDTINYYRVPVIISGLSGDTQLNAITALSTNMDIGVIFHYTDSAARYAINLYTGKCKSLRFDCFLDDTISKESLTSIIHPNYKLKLGGSNPAASEIKELLKWVDVCETARQYSEYI